MNDEQDIIITPINENENQEPTTVIKEETKKEVKEEDFVTGLPEWDLAPPYEVIRRVNRK